MIQSELYQGAFEVAVIIRGILPCRLNDVDDTEKAALSLILSAPGLLLI